jgi:hypothetical protein
MARIYDFMIGMGQRQIAELCRKVAITLRKLYEETKKNPFGVIYSLMQSQLSSVHPHLPHFRIIKWGLGKCSNCMSRIYASISGLDIIHTIEIWRVEITCMLGKSQKSV